MVKSILIFSLLIVSFLSFSQENIPIGTWRTHLSYRNATAVAIAGTRVYCGTDGALFYFDRSDNQLNTLTKQDGLNDQDVRALGYSPTSKALAIGYRSGKMDIIKENKIYPLNDIYLSKLFGSKTINHISIYNHNAIISGDFGITVLDLIKMEIKESYINIGPNGSLIQAYATAILDDSIYAATSKGILRANLKDRRLMDSRSWSLVRINDTLNNRIAKRVTAFKGTWAVAFDTIGVFVNDNGWKQIYQTKQNFTAFKGLNNDLFAAANNKIIKVTESGTEEIKGWYVVNPSDFARDGSATDIWYASNWQGLVNYFNEDRRDIYNPNGPISNQLFNLRYENGSIYMLQGGFDEVLTPTFKWGAFSNFEEGEWKTTYPNSNNVPNFQDLVSVTFDKAKNTLFFASSWNGIVAKKDEQYYFINDQTEKCRLFNTTFGVRVQDVFYDDFQEVTWVCNQVGDQGRSPSIHKIKNNNECESYYFEAKEALFPVQIITDNGNNKWIRGSIGKAGGGLFVFNEAKKIGETPVFKILKEGVASGNLPSNAVNCMVKDRNGDIWVGTGKGIAVYYSPDNITETTNPSAVTPIFGNFPLLFDQVVTAIDVDGGNRKWIGTSNGIYLFNPDGTRVIHYFNKENSPLISNSIVSIKVNQKTGEVFIGTDLGIVSYRESATLGNDDTKEVIVFPNPVKTNYAGEIGFSGLATDAIVKVTDISGRLVFEAQANGGGASWNGRDYNGKKISAGVYVILTSKSDGSSAVAGKLFVVD